MGEADHDPNELPRSILVVDDDDVFRRRLARALSDRGLRVVEASSAAEALALTTDVSPELASVDLRMPDRDGLALVRELHRRDPTTRIVVLTGFGSIATALDAVRLGATHYLTKPVDADELLAAFDPPRESSPKRVSLQEIERAHIESVMTSCGGNITQAARILGIHRRSLQRKLSSKAGDRSRTP